MTFECPSTVLIVDDESSIRDYLSELLRMQGYECRCFSESLEALSYLSQEEQPADLLLADISMPGMGGMDLLRTVKPSYPGLPVILISGLYELALAVDALDAGADDYLKKPVRPADVVTLVEKYLGPSSESQEREVRDSLRQFLDSRQSDPKSSAQLKELFEKLGFKRYETFQHSARVASISRLFGESCEIPSIELPRLELGALLHDIGKIGTPRNILMKPGKLTAEEWRVMREHPVIGYRMLAKLSDLQTEADLVHAHHERFDGRGYPRGLRGEEIPLGARIFAIVDAFAAMTSDRPYRSARPPHAARDEIAKMAGTQFDPSLAGVFLEIPEQSLTRLGQAYPDAGP